MRNVEKLFKGSTEISPGRLRALSQSSPPLNTPICAHIASELELVPFPTSRRNDQRPSHFASLNSNYRPVEVEVGQTVGEHLMDVGRQASSVENDVEIGRRNCALVDFLRHQEEIAALFHGDPVVHYRPARWIRWIVT